MPLTAWVARAFSPTVEKILWLFCDILAFLCQWKHCAKCYCDHVTAVCGVYSAGACYLNRESVRTDVASPTTSAANAFTCRVCLKSFSSSARLSRHKSSHFCRPRPPESYPTRDYFRVQVARKKFACFRCGRAFFAVSTRIRHQRRHLFSVSRYGFVCRSRTKPRKRLNVRRDATYVTCELRGTAFRYRPSFLTHLHRHGIPTSARKVWFIVELFASAAGAVTSSIVPILTCYKLSVNMFYILTSFSLQCSDTVGWATGRPSGP